jgi:hypothetical protein
MKTVSLVETGVPPESAPQAPVRGRRRGALLTSRCKPDKLPFCVATTNGEFLAPKRAGHCHRHEIAVKNKPSSQANKQIAGRDPAKENLKMKMTKFLYIAPVAALLAVTACKTTPQMTNRPEFLSTYDHLKQIDDLNSRYVNPVLLGLCNKFQVSPVKVLFTEIQGKPVTAEQRQRTSDFVRNAVIKALEDRYPIVTEAGPDVAEIRLAITGAYRTGGKVGLCVQGEILDNSNTQVAAAVRTELSELYVANWENRETARQMVNEWAQRLRKNIDEAHAK